MAKEQAAGEERPAAEADPIPEAQLASDYSETSFPRHAAWLDGDWKLHRIERPQGRVAWELYNLERDRTESQNLLAQEPDRAERMKTDVENWLRSVVRSLNGNDYSGQ